MAARKDFKLFLSGILSIFSALAFCIGTFAWFCISLPETDEYQTVGGEIGLRSYFYDGNGTEEFPYEIVSPIHFYNLTRLQNLGIFERKTYFTIGHEFDNIHGYQCMNPDGEGGYTYDSFLDMSSMKENEITLLSIGGEGAPFYGCFDGRNIPIVNLEISGYPEDIGVFGYVASNASVQNLVLKDLTINSYGYDSSKNNINQLFGSDVDDIFADETERFIKDGGVKFHINGSEIDLKNPNGLGGTSYGNINDSENVVTIDGVDYSNFYFTEYHPLDTKFNYYWRFSTTVVEKYEEDGEERARVNFTSLKNSEEFNSRDVYVDTRISLIASITFEGYVYSRVVQSYLCRIFSNNSTYDEGEYNMSLFCDFVTGDHTNYHHGNNIGFIAGHVDGKLNNCYLYNGSMNLNNGGLTPIRSESQTGLIGEIGSNVINDISPDIALQIHGDTGVMNFSKVYGIVRNNYAIGDSVPASPVYSGSQDSYVRYDSKVNDPNNLYKEFLRTDASTDRHYITKYNKTLNVSQNIIVDNDNYSYVNSIDFLNNKVISDEEDKDRGLGVFKLATNYNQTEQTEDNIGSTFALDLGKSRIVNNLEKKTKVYFSTAEIDHSIFGTNFKWDTSLNQLDNIGAEPSWSSVNTFSPLYQRDFDYIYELDLEQMNSTHGNNYMYNTDSPFLTNYLSSKLIDKFGVPVKYNTQRFGFMFRNSENEILNGLDSYMPIGYPSRKFAFEEDGQTAYYPSNSIVFKIENDYGANVSVIGNGDDISIYNFDSSTSSNTFTKHFTMHSSNNAYQKAYHNNTDGEDFCRYFTYDASNGLTSKKALDVTDLNSSFKRDNRLYAHIFKLPKGEYCIGSSNSDKTANVYFLAVQGQNEGTIGSNELPIMDNSIENVDFLLNDPTSTLWDDMGFSLVSMTMEFNISNGEFIVDSSSQVLKLIFDETDNRFIEYMLILDKKNSPNYIIHNLPSANNKNYNQKGNSYRGGA